MGCGGVLSWIFAVRKAVWVCPAVLSTIPLAVFAFPVLNEVVITLGCFFTFRTYVWRALEGFLQPASGRLARLSEAQDRPASGRGCERTHRSAALLPQLTHCGQTPAEPASRGYRKPRPGVSAETVRRRGPRAAGWGDSFPAVFPVMGVFSCPIWALRVAP